MSLHGWHSTTVKVRGDVDFEVRAEPFVTMEPMGDHRIRFDIGADDLTLILTVDQLDQLEHELERARWHRTFRQAELRNAPSVCVVPDDDPPPQDDVMGGGPESGEHAEPWVRP